MGDETIYDMIMEKMPPHVADSLTPDQKEALYTACLPVSWSRHPVNLRLTFSLMGRPYFVTLVSGQERRSLERRQRDQVLYPVMTVSNMLFLLGVGLALSAATLVTLFVTTQFLHF